MPAYDQGAHVTYLGPTGSQIGHKESMKDTARVLGRMYDAIEYRGFSPGSRSRLWPTYAGVPVYNGLTDENHPTQMLADLMTMREFTPQAPVGHDSRLHGRWRNNVAPFAGDRRGQGGHRHAHCGARALWPDDDFIAHVHGLPNDTAGR